MGASVSGIEEGVAEYILWEWEEEGIFEGFAREEMSDSRGRDGDSRLQAEEDGRERRMGMGWLTGGSWRGKAG